MKTQILILFLILANNIIGSNNNLNNEIEKIIKPLNAQVGVAYKYDQDSIVSIHNEMYPTMSVYKLHLALATLNYLKNNNLNLNDSIYINKQDLREDTWSPFREKYPTGNIHISYKTAIEYIVTVSDNNICDLLFKIIGGVKTVENYIRSIGIKDIDFNMTEGEMETDFKNQYKNSTSPKAMVHLFYTLFNKEVFNYTDLKFMWETLIASSTGMDKIKGELVPCIIVGHKTGNSSRNIEGLKAADNDSGFIIMPNGKLLYLTIFIKNSAESDKINAQTIARISKTIYDFYK